MLSAEATIYLNNAASAHPRAPGVVDAMVASLREMPQHPGRTVGREQDAATECRCRLAGLLGVDDPHRIILTVNATHALNIAILGAPLGQGDRVVTTVTEHNSVLRPLNRLEQILGIEIEIVGFDAEGGIDREAWNRAMERDPALVAVNHASNVTGRLNDAAWLLMRAREAGAVTLLDASQSLGHRPVHPRELGADLVAFTGHKGLHGPPGTGGLYVADGLDLQQVLVGGTGVRSDLALHPPEMPMRLETGTPNLPALAGLAAALRWLEGRGEEHIRNEDELAQQLRDGLRSIPAVTVCDDVVGVDRLGVVSFVADGWDVEEVGYVLGESFGVVCRTGLHCAPLIHEAIGSAPHGTVRLSVSGFNTEDEIDTAVRAVSAVRRLAA